MDLNANWKLAVENYLEAYHLPTVHPELNRVSPLADHEIHLDERFAGQISHCYSLGVGKGEHLPVFPDWPADVYSEAEYPVLFPNTLLGIQADHLFVMVVIPEACDKTRRKLGSTALGTSRWTLVLRSCAKASTGSGQRSSQRTSGWSPVCRRAESPQVLMGVLTPLMETATARFHQWVGERVSVSLNEGRSVWN